MIRLVHCNSSQRAVDYFRLHLDPGDLVTHPLKPSPTLRAQWLGPALDKVGLNRFSTPSADHLRRLADGLHPTNRQRLATSANRKRAYYDLTVAAPKTVSLAALVQPEHPTALAIVNAHLAAVRAVADAAGGMIRSQWRNKPGDWLAALFTHTHTREGDPHLHSHLVVPNLMLTAEENRWRALQIVIAGQGRATLGLCYHHELTRHLRRAGLGNEIRQTPTAAPEIASLLPLVPRFSRARQAILQASRAVPASSRSQPSPTRPKTPARAVLVSPVVGVDLTRPDARRRALQRRQRLADRLRRVKPKDADDPRTLSQEGQRWLGGLDNAGAWSVLRLLDVANEAVRGGASFRDVNRPPARSARATVRVLFSEMDRLGDTPASWQSLLRASVAASGGRHSFEDLIAAVTRVVEVRNAVWKSIRAAEGEEVPILAQAMAGITGTPVSVTPRVTPTTPTRRAGR